MAFSYKHQQVKITNAVVKIVENKTEKWKAAMKHEHEGLDIPSQTSVLEPRVPIAMPCGQHLELAIVPLHSVNEISVSLQ